MKLLGIKLLHDFKKKYAEARSQLEAWQIEVEEAQWATPLDIKKRYPKARLLSNQQVVFDFCWNKYRLLVLISYKNGIVLIKKVGTHKEYDNWGTY
ncbi:MAG: type II toxin-antitoxin system HigB family toxin [Proteobacteria bacterium]|nr:type II toxin-antitoxin system HigB family toxin [Pseudomonadota bacterium]